MMNGWAGGGWERQHGEQQHATGMPRSANTQTTTNITPRMVYGYLSSSSRWVSAQDSSHLESSTPLLVLGVPLGLDALPVLVFPLGLDALPVLVFLLGLDALPVLVFLLGAAGEMIGLS